MNKKRLPCFCVKLAPMLRQALCRLGCLFLYLILVLILPTENTMARDDVLEVIYMERPPYYVTRHDKPEGFLLERALQVIHEAGISTTTRSLPVKRILQMVKEGNEDVVAVGWFINEERLEWAQFSELLYQDQPLVALHREKSKAVFGEENQLECLLKIPDLRLGLLDGFSYGDSVDAMIKAVKPTKFVLAGDQIQLVKMLAAGRIDYILIAPEEVSYILSCAQMGEGEFSFTFLRDMPEGNCRYLMFSKSVDPAVIHRIDAVLTRSAFK